ncbi:DinB family protein [Salinicoccus sp. ID82-1]|uniref:DinB family protein n=1 Tax=Salinicoccus sp. ID82-1 TaxID=2820269 RepID=UPI001F3B815A|nr:DinB family protein [Salinicoccus sp. ID82-1]
MIHFFKYNWQVREEWMDRCSQLSDEILVENRTGGPGSILYTLFHIIDVEQSWIRSIRGKEDIVYNFEDYNSLEKVKKLSDRLRKEVADYLDVELKETEDRIVSVPWDEEEFTRDEILLHVTAHEIHHIGQLSIWARELGLEPVTANFIRRNLMSIQK